MKWLVSIVRLFPSLASATYSIAACDPMSGVCGVAVQTNNLAVGASVPSARAGIGAVASQFETNPAHGPRLLALLEQGMAVESALRDVLSGDSFEGQGAEARQVGVVAANGKAAAYTGDLAKSAAWAGSRSGNGYTIQGNGLAGPQVAQAMETAYLKSTGPLAERLMAALSAGDEAGGQSTGKDSAALLVRTPQGWPVDIDLRVDHSSQPVQELQALYGMHVSRQTLAAAERELQRGNAEAAVALIKRSVALAPHWPRTLLRSAKLAMELQEWELALAYLTEAFRVGPLWRDAEIGSGKYAALGRFQRFQRLVTARQKAAVLAQPSTEALLHAAALLEVGEPALARRLLTTLDPPPAEAIFLLAVTDSAEGHPKAALERVRRGKAAYPKDRALTLYEARLAKELAAGR